MRERASRVTLPTEVRQQVKHEQGCCCLVCGELKNEHDLYVHHIKPVSHHPRGQGEYANRRENLCALCGDCHDTADHMALEKGVYLNQIMDMKIGVEYSVKR